MIKDLLALSKKEAILPVVEVLVDDFTAAWLVLLIVKIVAKSIDLV